MTAEVGWAFHMSKTSMPPLMVGSTRRYSGHLVLTITELPGNLKDPFRRLDTHPSRTRKRPGNSGRSNTGSPCDVADGNRCGGPLAYPHALTLPLAGVPHARDAQGANRGKGSRFSAPQCDSLNKAMLPVHKCCDDDRRSPENTEGCQCRPLRRRARRLRR